MENISFGLLLMVIGMVTVFIILLVVIFIGKVLTSAVNRVAPESAPVQQRSSSQSHQPLIIDASTMAAIKAAVNIVTNGKGKVTNIEKI